MLNLDIRQIFTYQVRVSNFYGIHIKPSKVGYRLSMTVEFELTALQCNANAVVHYVESKKKNVV